MNANVESVRHSSIGTVEHAVDSAFDRLENIAARFGQSSADGSITDLKRQRSQVLAFLKDRNVRAEHASALLQLHLERKQFYPHPTPEYERKKASTPAGEEFLAALETACPGFGRSFKESGASGHKLVLEIAAKYGVAPRGVGNG